MATIETAFEQVIAPVTHDLGDFKVNRTLPARERTMVGPFIFVDEFGPARLPAGGGMDVRPHPHINLATVTYLFEGAIEHRDSIGSHAVIEPGAVNLMTAGSGIVHSERSPEGLRASGPSLYGMQTWLALPDGREEVEPAFDHVPADRLPVIEDSGVHARVLMGALWGAKAATPQHSPTIYADIELTGGSLPIEADADERAVMLVGGAAELDGQPLELFTLYVLRPGHQARLVSRAQDVEGEEIERLPVEFGLAADQHHRALVGPAVDRDRSAGPQHDVGIDGRRMLGSRSFRTP